VTDFKQLKVWRKAHEMTLDTYQVTAAFPKEERYGLKSATSLGRFDWCKYRRGLRAPI
jgi:hypothetical protein